jgi:aspartyl/asparaginyl beta-hydroxylase (cupin superfamily)
MDNPNWGALYLWEYGRIVEENTDLFKQTMKALDIVPFPRIRTQLPIVLFSRLAARTHIPRHHGMLNTRLICHLPLVVPANCGALRCGNEQRSWREGETLIFDDSIEHEAWNNSNQERVVLLFDIWRPELTQEERELVTQVLEIVREYNEQ